MHMYSTDHGQLDKRVRVTRVQCSAARKSISGNRVYPSRVHALVHVLARAHASIRDSTAKNLASLKATYSVTASLCSTSLLKLSKTLVPRRVTVLTITFTSTRDLPPLSCWCNNWTTPHTYSRVRMRICARVRVLALARRRRLLHPRVNVQAARVTSSLLALVYQVTRDRYCTCILI
jgi:hypothetical protein